MGNREIDELISLARNFVMTDEQRREQRISFAFGNTSIENPLITREMFDDDDRRG